MAAIHPLSINLATDSTDDYCLRKHMLLKTLIPNMQLALVVPIVAMLAFGAVSQNYPIAKPNCMDRCGNVTIPYPFGTNKSCYHSNSFRVTCNQSFHNPPKLFLHNTTIEITHISKHGQMVVMQSIAKDCTHWPDGKTIDFDLHIVLPDSLTINSTANMFTVVGCDAFGFVEGREIRRNYSTGCIATCESKSDPQEGECSGSGCCQISIPRDGWEVGISVGSLNNHSQVRGFSDCTYGFLVEQNSFRFSPDNLTNLNHVRSLPMVVDWAIGNATCEEAKKTSDYACTSTNSHCYKPETGYGYRCLCNDGYYGNPYLSDGCQDINECLVKPKKCKHRCVNNMGGFHCSCPKWYRGDGKVDGNGCQRDYLLIVKIMSGVASGIILLLLAAWLVSVQIRRRQYKKLVHHYFIQNGGVKLKEELNNLGYSQDSVKMFSECELEKATNGFHHSTVLGQGTFGRVYKGKLSDNREVAIKKPRGFVEKQVDQFISEAIALSQINHKCVVKLLGCCFETKIPLLVYEFISNGDLASYIHDPEKSPLLNWDMRLKIAHQTAQVLSYLHSETSHPIIHRDIKSQNILLDQKFTAKVADFGASRLVPDDESPHPTVVIGTLGYVDPEYRETRQLTTKTDVYSFGVVLFELLTGKWPIIKDGNEERSLVEPFLSVMQQPNSHENIFQQVDAEIVTKGNEVQIIQVAKLAVWCLKEKGVDRPSMKDVENELQKLRLERQSSLVKTEESQTTV